MFFQCFGRLQVRENEISLCKWSGGTAQFRTLEAGRIQLVTLGWDISVVISFITASRCKKKWCILHYTAVTKQWTTELPYIANNKAIRTWRKYKTMVNRVTFLDFKVGNRPPESALFRGSIGFRNALFWQQCLVFTHASFRHVTSLGHQGVRGIFWEGSKNFEPCPIVLNFVQHVFPGEVKNLPRGASPPATLVTVLASLHIVQTRGGKTCSMVESFAENQKHRRVAKPVHSFNTNTIKNASFTLPILSFAWFSSPRKSGQYVVRCAN